jgi:hypothetical protein
VSAVLDDLRHTEQVVHIVNETEWDELSPKITAVEAEVDREIGSYEGRNGAMQGRAGVLVAAASVVGSIQYSVGSSKVILYNLVAAVIAAVIGLILAAPIGVRVLNMNLVEKRLISMGVNEGRLALLDQKISMLNKNERQLNIRGAFTIIGYLFLALALASSFWSATHASSPSPTHVIIDSK